MSHSTIEFIDLAAQRKRLGPQIEQAIARVLDHGRFVLGPEVGELEARLQTFSGARHCVTCANGTDALELGLAALGVGPGDAVIVPAFTYLATAEAVVRLGATPVFADVDQTSFNMCGDSAEAAIGVAKGLGLNVRCIIPVDLFGQPADYDMIGRLAEKHGLKVLADAAQSFGASWRGRKVGSLADVTITSFYPSKPLGCYGDGGAVFTDDPEIASLLRSLRNHGPADSGAIGERIGRNSRLDTIQAAILLEKLSIFESEIEARNTVARRYAERLPRSVVAPTVHQENLSVWAQYTLKVPGDRNAIAAACRASGTPIAVHYTAPLHWLPTYKRFPTATPRLAGAEQLSTCVMSLPMHGYLDEATQDRVIDAVRRAVDSCAQSPSKANA